MNVFQIVRTILIDTFNVMFYPLIQGLETNGIWLNIGFDEVIVASTCITGVLYVLRKLR